MKTVINTHTVCRASEANKVILNHLKINFKEVTSKKTKTKYLQLLRNSDVHPNQWEMIEELNRWRVQNFLDIILQD